MKYRSKDAVEKDTYFKDLLFVQCWYGTAEGILFEEGNRKAANKAHKRSRSVVGITAVVTVYPAPHDYDIEITPDIANRAAIGFMTGKGVTHYSLRD